jgi:hypothetical protein
MELRPYGNCSTKATWAVRCRKKNIIFVSVSTMVQSNIPTTTKGIQIGTYNIQHHGNGRLYQVLRSMHQMNVDVGILMEVKAREQALLPSSAQGYKVVCFREGGSNTQGGVLLFNLREQ